MKTSTQAWAHWPRRAQTAAAAGLGVGYNALWGTRGPPCKWCWVVTSPAHQPSLIYYRYLLAAGSTWKSRQSGWWAPELKTRVALDRTLMKRAVPCIMNTRLSQHLQRHPYLSEKLVSELQIAGGPQIHPENRVYTYSLASVM